MWGPETLVPSAPGGCSPAALGHILPAGPRWEPPHPRCPQGASRVETQNSASAMGWSVPKYASPTSRGGEEVSGSEDCSLSPGDLPAPAHVNLPRCTQGPNASPVPCPLTNSSCFDSTVVSRDVARSCCWVSLSTGERSSLRQGSRMPNMEPSPPLLSNTNPSNGLLTSQCSQQVEDRGSEFRHQFSRGEHQTLEDAACWAIQRLHLLATAQALL